MTRSSRSAVLEQGSEWAFSFGRPGTHAARELPAFPCERVDFLPFLFVTHQGKVETSRRTIRGATDCDGLGRARVSLHSTAIGEIMFKKAVFVAAFVGVLFASGCATVPMASPAEDAALKSFEAPPADKAGVYIYRNSVVGQALKKNVYLDGEYLGESANKVYFYRQVEPGQHTVSTESEFSDNALTFHAKGGMNHFIRQYIKMGVFVGGANVELVSEDEGRKGVSASKLAE